jgi:hypothetical protein
MRKLNKLGPFALLALVVAVSYLPLMGQERPPANKQEDKDRGPASADGGNKGNKGSSKDDAKDKGSSLSVMKDALAIARDVVTILGIALGGWWAILKFGLFRQLAENAIIKIKPSHLVKPDHYLLYVQVEIQNIGNVKIPGRCCSLFVTPIVDGKLDEAHKWKEDRPCQCGDDPGSLNVIDKKEFSTFVFVLGLNFTSAADRPEACKIIAVFSSESILKQGGRLGWIREEVYLFDTEERDSGGAAEENAGKP